MTVCPRLHELPPPPSGKQGWPWTEETSPLATFMPDGRPWPRMTVVTPSFNQGRFLEETIRSVLLQGYPDLEYVVIDGGSTDGSLEVIKKYEKWIDYWVSEPDRGQTHAINKGFTRATGDVLAYLNSDDIYMKRILQVAGKVFCHFPEIDVVYGGARFVCDGRILGNFGSRSFKNLFSIPIPQPASFVRSAIIKEVGYLDESYHYAMDSNLWMRLKVKGCSFRYEPEILAGMRIHKDAKSSACYYKWWEEYIRSLDECLGHDYPRYREIVGRACWHASWSYWQEAEESKALYHANKGIEFLPNFLISRDFIGIVIYGLCSVRQNARGKFVLDKTDLELVEKFIDAMPVQGSIKARALRRARVVFYGISGLQRKPGFVTLKYLCRAFCEDPGFTIMLACSRLFRIYLQRRNSG